MRDRIQRLPQGPEGSVTVAVPFLLASLLMGPFLAGLKQTHPGIRVFVIDDLSLVVKKTMLERRADVGILVDAPQWTACAASPWRARPCTSAAMTPTVRWLPGCARRTLRPAAAGPRCGWRGRSSISPPLRRSRWCCNRAASRFVRAWKPWRRPRAWCGFNVYPSEVEAVRYQHEAVADACVFPMPDDKWGESVAAHVVLKPGRVADGRALDAFCAERLAGFKRPRHIEFVAALAKNPDSKMMRKAIQAPYWAGHSRMVN